jgi:hypothetical protein
MINRKSTFFLGIFIFLIPYLGIPSSWKTFFIVTSGIVLMVLSIKITLPKKTTKSRTRKEKITPVYVESIPAYPRENNIDGIVTPNSEVKFGTNETSINQN